MQRGQIIKMNDNQNIEVCLFPMEHLFITQGPGFNSDGTDNPASPSHAGSWAVDNIGEATDIRDENNDIIEQKISDVFAPVTVKLVKKCTDEIDGEIYGHACVFSSVNPVLFPDLTIDYLDMEIVHCDNIDFLVEGNTYAQGSLIYREGNHGYSDGSHVHIEVRKRGTHSIPNGFHQFFTNEYGVWQLKDNEPIQGIFFLNDTAIISNVPTIFGAPSWQYYNVASFNASGKTNGWHEYNGDSYYVINEVVQTGWITIDNETFYFDLSTGVMQKGLKELAGTKYYFDPSTGVLQTGWRTLDGDIYYFDSDNYGAAVIGWETISGEYYCFDTDGCLITSCWIYDGTIPMYYVDSTGKRLRGWVQLAYPEETEIHWFYFNNPNDYNVTGLNSGQLARSKWIASGSYWYYVGPEGKMVTNDWVASGSDWYFVLSDGKMAYSCQIRDTDGKYYAFKTSGVCMNSSGNADKYNETTYPLVADYYTNAN